MDSTSLEVINDPLDNLPIYLSYRPHDCNKMQRMEDPVYKKYLDNFNNNSFSFNVYTMVPMERTTKQVNLLDLKMADVAPHAIFLPGFNESADHDFFGSQIVIPHSFWKKSFFDFNYPDVINYARFGTTISHELAHALQGFINIKGTHKN